MSTSPFTSYLALAVRLATQHNGRVSVGTGLFFVHVPEAVGFDVETELMDADELIGSGATVSSRIIGKRHVILVRFDEPVMRMSEAVAVMAATEKARGVAWMN